MRHKFKLRVALTTDPLSVIAHSLINIFNKLFFSCLQTNLLAGKNDKLLFL